MTVVFANNVSTTLTADITATATDLTLASATGWPAIAGGDHAWVTLDDSTNIEVVKATARIGAALQVERGQDGTTAATFSSGTVVEMRICAALLTDIQGGGTGTITHHLYFGASTTALTSFNAGTLATLQETTDAPGEHDVTIDGSSLADGWTAYIVTVDPSLLQNVYVDNFQTGTFQLPANTGTLTSGGETYHIYSAPNQRGGIRLNLRLEITQ